MAAELQAPAELIQAPGAAPAAASDRIMPAAGLFALHTPTKSKEPPTSGTSPLKKRMNRRVAIAFPEIVGPPPTMTLEDITAFVAQQTAQNVKDSDWMTSAHNQIHEHVKRIAAVEVDTVNLQSSAEILKQDLITVTATVAASDLALRARLAENDTVVKTAIVTESLKQNAKTEELHLRTLENRDNALREDTKMAVQTLRAELTSVSAAAYSGAPLAAPGLSAQDSMLINELSAKVASMMTAFQEIDLRQRTYSDGSDVRFRGAEAAMTGLTQRHAECMASVDRLASLINASTSLGHAAHPAHAPAPPGPQLFAPAPPGPQLFDVSTPPMVAAFAGSSAGADPLTNNDSWARAITERERAQRAGAAAGGHQPSQPAAAPPSAWANCAAFAAANAASPPGIAPGAAAPVSSNVGVGPSKSIVGSKPLFDDKIASSADSRYNEKSPHDWVKITENYIIGRTEDAGKFFLNWAQERQEIPITDADI